jgi:hypothetical protein
MRHFVSFFTSPCKGEVGRAAAGWGSFGLPRKSLAFRNRLSPTLTLPLSGGGKRSAVLGGDQPTNRTVQCSHGEERAALICQHLLGTLYDEIPRGVLWSRDEDGCINAYCSDCDKRLQAAGGEWTEEVEAQLKVKIICEGCFRRIAVINGFSELD